MAGVAPASESFPPEARSHVQAQQDRWGGPIQVQMMTEGEDQSID